MDAPDEATSPVQAALLAAAVEADAAMIERSAAAPAAPAAAEPATTAAAAAAAPSTPPPPPPPPYPGALPRASWRFSHIPELLLFAVDVSAEAALPATRNASAGGGESSSQQPPPPPTRFDALASVALLVARAKAALLPSTGERRAASSSSRRRHRFGLLACGAERAEYVRGSVCTEPAQLAAALARLREAPANAAAGSSPAAPAFDFGSLADAAGEAARDAAAAASPSVRVVLLYTRSRAPPPLPLSRGGALDALWRCRASLPPLFRVDVLYAYDPSSAAAAAASAGAAEDEAAAAAAAATTTTTTPQQVFSVLEACVDAVSAAVPHALAAHADSSSSPPSASFLQDAARRNHGYVLDVSVFAPRRLLGAACQLASHPLQRPALARPPPPPDLSKVRSVPLPSEGGSRKAQQLQQKREEQERQSALLERQRSLQQGGGGDEGGGNGGADADEDARDEWGLPLPPPPEPAQAAAGDVAVNPAAAAPLLVDITDQVAVRTGGANVSSFPVVALGTETDGGEDDGAGGGGGGGGGGGSATPAQAQRPTIPASPPPPPMSPLPPGA